MLHLKGGGEACFEARNRGWRKEEGGGSLRGPVAGVQVADSGIERGEGSGMGGIRRWGGLRQREP